MRAPTITARRRSPRRGLRRSLEGIADRRLALAGASIVLVESALASLGLQVPLLTAAALLAPGLAFAPLLPVSARRDRLTELAAAPALGFAVTSVVLISLTSVGISLTPLAIRLALAGEAAFGLLVVTEARALTAGRRPARGTVLAAVGLLVAVAAGVVLQDRVIGGWPLPGNDWAKYVLYADEVRRQHALLIQNPFWMLGVPFREDPGVPAVFGSFLALTGQPAAAVAHGIWLFAVMGILSMFVFVRSLWGVLAGCLAATLLAVVPMSQDILAWHGLANSAALALFPLLLLYLATLLRRELMAPQAAGLALLLVAIAASHRLSFIVAGVTTVAVIAVAAMISPRRQLLAGLRRTAIAGVLIAPGVAVDMVARNSSFGGTQGYAAYLSQKVDWTRVALDLSLPFSLVAVVAVGLGLARRRRRRALVVPLCLLGAVVGLSYAWLAHQPFPYIRLAYFLPFALVPLVAVALSGIGRARSAVVVGAALSVAVLAVSLAQASNVRRFYSFVTPASLRGLDAVAAQLHPGEVVVTDRCWSFLATWLLHTRTLSALDPADIGPKAEVGPAQQAHQVLAGTPEGRALAHRLGVRFILVDPACLDAARRSPRPLRVGRLFFASERLAVLRVDGG